MKKQKYKILYVNKSSEIGGAEMSLLLLLKYMRRDIFEPVVVLPSEGTFSNEIRELGLQVFIIPLNNINLRRFNPLPYAATVWKLFKIIKKEHIDLVHANDVATNQYSLVASKLSGVPIVCHMRGLNDKKTVLRGFLPWADSLIANSHAVAQTFRLYRKNPEHVDVIYNGVDEKLFSDDNISRILFRQKYGILEKTFLLGIIGRIFPEKGHHILVQAFSEVRKKYTDICLAIIGPMDNPTDCKYQRDNAFVSDLKELIVRLGLGKDILYIEEQRDMRSVYQAMDLVVLPTFTESFGRVAAEAMAAGKPVVASAVGGVPEVIENGVTGILMPPGDILQLAEAICSILAHKDIAQQMGIAGRKRAKKLFSIDNNVRQTEEVYQRYFS